MKFLYNFFILVYYLSIKIASLFNAKAKLWVLGRKNIFEHLQSTFKDASSEIIWFHCASLGEFEQARPIIESIRKHETKYKILLTFFSPSGYEIRKNYAQADYIYYLPIDTIGNARKWIEIIKPSKVFFVKYEFWFNYLNELKRKEIPTYLVSGIFRDDHYFFKWYGGWFVKQLSCFTHFYLQDEKSISLLKSKGITNTTLAGDTRFDRVNDIANSIKTFPIVEQFKKNTPVLIMGSSWKEDETVISEINLNEYKVILAPHEIDESHIQSIIQLFSKRKILRYSQANSDNVSEANMLIIDNIGMLSSLYQYGAIAYIGGGFGKGIHNILEAATFGLPVLFGPNYNKFNEAKELIQLGGGFTFSNTLELEKTMKLLHDKIILQKASQIAKNYVQGRIGATEIILRQEKLI